MKYQTKKNSRGKGLPSLVWIALPCLLGLLAAWRVWEDWTAVSIVAVLSLGSVVALVVHRVSASKRGSHVDELTQLNRAVMETLATAIDAQDQSAHFHARRVEELAVGLGERLGLNAEDIEGLRASALLRDIGKLAVPDYILNKPDDLTPAEYAKVKMHSAVGAEILKGINFPYPVERIVRHHHERFDGKGYPDGLAGEEIPLGSRILAVVDCFVAILCDRPYRPRMAREAAIEMLRRERGTAFDPAVLNVFLEHLDEIESRAKAIETEPRSRGIAEIPRAETSEETTTEDPNAGPASALATISEAQREIYALYELAQTVRTSLNLQDLLAVIASKLERLIPFTTCVLNLADEASGHIRAAHVVGAYTDFFKDRIYQEGSGVTGWAVANRRSMANTTPELDFSETEREMASRFRAIAVYPLSKGTRSLGAISLYSSELPEYSADHVRLLEVVALHASDAIFNAMTFEQAARSAETDLLTGLCNARAFHNRFQAEFSKSAESGLPLTILNMDLDGFKAINDTLGHQAGDRVLVDVAHALRRQFREADLLTRYAGDEFLAILPGIDRRHAQALIERIQKAVDGLQEKMRDRQTLSVGISVGAASYPGDGETLEELMATADRRMFENKRVRKSVADHARSDGVLKFRPPKK